MTNTEKSQLGGVKQTLLNTLYYRALDQRSKAPIVGDTWAADVLDRIKADNRKGLWTAKLGASGRFPPLLRARRLDDWTREFLASHPDASVLHLGCGLDSRAFRLDVPERTRWYDLDFPDVIELRRRLYPERAGYRLLSATVTFSARAAAWSRPFRPELERNHGNSLIGTNDSALLVVSKISRCSYSSSHQSAS